MQSVNQKTIKGKWSEDEIKLLKKLFPEIMTEEVAEILGRSLPSVNQKAYGIGIKKVSTAPVWTNEEIELLKKLYPNTKTRDIATQIGHPESSVISKVKNLR